MKAVRVIVFAKAPIAGFAKTRLIPALGPEGAAILAKKLLIHTLHQALNADIGPVELCVTPRASAPVWVDMVIPDGVEWSDQGMGDLGERMARAASRTLDQSEAAVLIGTDCPQLDASRLHWAAASLNEYDATMIPTVDGGYALLGLNRFHPLLFQAMEWSTDAVAFNTLCRLGQLGWSVGRHALLHDIDEPADLKWLPLDWSERQAAATGLSAISSTTQD